MQSSPPSLDNRDCRDCPVRHNCLPAQLDDAAIPRFRQIVTGHLSLAKHRKFLTQDTPFSHVYVLRSGQCKAEHQARDGTRKVVGFYGPGQMVGLEGLGTRSYRFDAVTLCDSEVCEIPYAMLAALMAEQAPLLAQFHMLLGTQLDRLQRAMLMLGGATAPQRIAGFLLDLSQQHAALGESGELFNLRMSREEIGSYLGLAVESISRVLTRLRAEGLINVSNRKIVVRDAAGLRRMAEMTL
jgi:CRP/FNR family transcriptional regulator